MSARMGIFQETLYKQFGKHSKEALFYNVGHHVFSVAFTGQIELLRESLPLLSCTQHRSKGSHAVRLEQSRVCCHPDV